MQDTAHKVANGGIHGAGWQGRPDPGTGAVNDASLDVKGFTDIVGGTTNGPADQGGGGYTAVAGYDLATGWGTPNLTSLIANWQ